MFRVVYSPNGLEPFISNQPDYISAVATANLIADFNLGRIPVEKNFTLIVYESYRKRNKINDTKLIVTSTCSIEQVGQKYRWYVVSKSLGAEPDFTLDDKIEGYPG